MPNPKVFISHSSRDKQLAHLLSNLLRAAFGLLKDEILCTSSEDYQSEPGNEIPKTLPEQVTKAEVFIVLISPSSMKSLYVLLETGARWGTGKKFYPVLAPNAPRTSLPGPLRDFHALDTQNSRLAMAKLLQNLKIPLGTNLRELTEYADQLELIVKFAEQQKSIPNLPTGAEDGVVSRGDLVDYSARLPGEVFAVELLTRDVQLKREVNGDVVVKIDRRDVEECIISNQGKSIKVAEYVTKRNRPVLLQLDKDIQRFLVGKSQASGLTLHLRQLDTRLRWASGGVLSIVTFRNKKWVPLFFRDIHPYGWNLSLGQPERQFALELPYDLDDELNRPWNYISREFLEETMVIDRTPSPPEEAYRRAFQLNYSGREKPTRIADGFAREHRDYRLSEDKLKIVDGADRIDASIVNKGFRLEITDRNGAERKQEHVLVCFSLLDLGIEVVTILEYRLEDNDYMLDGEILVDSGKNIKELVRMPIVLMSCRYLSEVFGGNEDWFQYTRGPEPSIEIEKPPGPDDVWLFDWDIKQRMLVVDGEQSGEWKRKRYVDWFDKFRHNFFDRNGTQTIQNLPRLFVPGTAKILNLYFTLFGR